MNKIFNHTVKHFIILSIVSVMILSCTQQRQGSTQKGGANSATTDNIGTLDKGVNYEYPHAKDWKASHIEYSTKYGKNVEGTDKDCAECHNEQNRKLGSPKNLSCAIQCHSPVKTPEGSAPIANPPIAESGKACFECHKANFNRQKQHYPAAAGLCTTCHTVDSTHSVDKTKKTVKTPPANAGCISCHGKMTTHSEVHDPVTMNANSCVYCHDAHGSNHAQFTTDKLPELCLDCHENIIEDNAKSVHGIIHPSGDNKKSCMNCHNSHSSDFKPLLKKDKKALCLSCHDREFQTKSADGTPRTIPNIKEKIKSSGVHPIAKNEANCTKCHSSHSSKNSALLIKNYPVNPYEKYIPAEGKTPNTYALCFSCHEEGMLSKEAAPEDTAFRNETKDSAGKTVSTNLHWFHVVNAADSQDITKGRTCFVCHDPHGSEQPHSIKTSFQMNATTQVKINYKQNGDMGGECAKTCHSDPVKKYTRTPQ